MGKPASSVLPHGFAFMAGLAICLAVTFVSGRKEAWDSPLYFMAGIPAMCLVIIAISYFFPVRTWRWAFIMALGQSVAMVIGGGSASLWPLAIIAMTVVSVPQFVVAMITGRIAQKRLPPDEAES